MTPISLLSKLCAAGVRTTADLRRFIAREKSALRAAKGFNRVRIVRRIRAAERIQSVLK